MRSRKSGSSNSRCVCDLLWLGVRTLTGVAASTAVAATAGPVPWGASLLRGVGISGSNPKAILLFLALLPQFTDRAGSRHWRPRSVLAG